MTMSQEYSKSAMIKREKMFFIGYKEELMVKEESPIKKE